MSSDESLSLVQPKTHHIKQELCLTRPQYRQGKKLTAVKVYTVNDESQYLLIQGVPAIAVRTELECLCQRFGSIEFLHHIPDYPSDKFCEVYKVKYHTIQSSRFAKRQMDDKNFYGGNLHVCYAPELETVDDTRYKLMQRQREIAGKLNPLVNNRKRSHLPSLLVQSSSTGSNISEEANSHDEIRLPTLEPNCSLSETVPVQFPSPSKNSKKTAAIPAVKRIVYHQSRKKPNAGLNVSRTTNQTVATEEKQQT